MTEPRLAALCSILSDAALWCFSFVTLFNLQGTRPVRLGGGTCSILPRRLAFVKRFLQLFSKFFQRFPRLSPLSRTAHLFYQSCQLLSSTFFASSKVFLPLTPARPPRSRQLAYYTRPSPTCQSLSRIFFLIFLFSSFCPRLRKSVARPPLSPPLSQDTNRRVFRTF